jgi:hypothetical protein
MGSADESRAVARSLACAKTFSAYTPRAEVIRSFRPDELGRLQAVSRQEAIDRGMSFYLSSRLCALSKCWENQDGGFGTIRYCANGNSVGAVAFYKKEARAIEKAQRIALTESYS